MRDKIAIQFQSCHAVCQQSMQSVNLTDRMHKSAEFVVLAFLGVFWYNWEKYCRPAKFVIPRLRHCHPSKGWDPEMHHYSKAAK